MLLLKLSLMLLACQQFTVSVAPAVPKFTVSVVEPVAVPEPVARSYVVSMFTTDYCGVCRSWEAVELPKLKAAGVEITVTNVTNRNVWKIGSVPEFWITDRVTGEPIEKFSGYTSAATLSRAAARKIERAVKQIAKATKPRYQIYNGGPNSSHANRASLINHLMTQGVHAGQHTLAQLDAMSDQELDDLHTEDHRANGQVRHVSGPVQQSVESPGRYAVWQGSTYDLESFQGCSARGCKMCANLTAKQQAYFALKAAQSGYQPTSLDANIPDHQQPTPDAMIDRMLDLMRLNSDDVLADYGCGSGGILIEAVRRSNCRAIGIEIDVSLAAKARRAVADAGLSSKIEIRTGDVLDFDPVANGVTAAVAYLYPELLEKLAQKLATARVASSPFHHVPGLEMTEYDSIWVYRK